MASPPRGLPFATEADYHVHRRRDQSFQHEVLAFRLGDEDYALDIRRIREIIKPRPITEVPRAPALVLGIISVRGQIIPVVDLRRRLRLPISAAAERAARILIVTRNGEDFGVIVDGVRQVVRLRDADIELRPAMLGGPDAELIAGIGRPSGGAAVVRGGLSDRLLVLLDLDAALAFLGGPS